MIKLSKANKMPCKSWSLQAIDTCPASKDSNGDLVPACQGCYATTGNYRFPNVKAPREHNREDWKRDAWVDDMVQELDTERYFRWFDSGDVYDLRLADKILAVMIATPWVKHWLPTRMHKFPKFAPVLAEMDALSNVVVRLSSDSVIGETIQRLQYIETSLFGPEYKRDGEIVGANRPHITGQGREFFASVTMRDGLIERVN